MALLQMDYQISPIQTDNGSIFQLTSLHNEQSGTMKMELLGRHNKHSATEIILTWTQ